MRKGGNPFFEKETAYPPFLRGEDLLRYNLLIPLIERTD
jgi:hypothetical protein